MKPLSDRFISFLRWSERYTKTDMVYLASSGFWVNMQVLTVSISSFIFALACANLLPVSIYGTYQYFVSFIALFTSITLTGMNYAITQAVARGHEGMVGQAVRTQLIWGIIPFCIGIMVGGFYLYQGQAELGIGIIAIGLFAPLASAFNTYSAFLNGRKKFKEGFIANLVLTTTYLVCMLLTVIYIKEALALILVNVFISAVTLFGVFVWTTKTYKPNDSNDPETLPYGKHLSAMYAFSLMVRQIDGIIVFHILGAIPLAIYSIATAVPERIGGFFRFLFTTSLPKFSTQSRESIRASLIPKMLRVTGVAAIIAVVYILFAPLFFSLLFPQYTESIPYSQFYALILIAAAGNLSTSALLSQRLKAELYIFNTALPLLQLILQAVLILLYGLWGILFARVLISFLEVIVSVALLYMPSSKVGV